MLFKKKKSISEYAVREEFSDVFVVRFTKELRTTTTGKYFFEAKIQDALGDAMLKYWGSEDKNKVSELLNSIKEDDVILVEGRVSEYNGKIDFSVNNGKLRVLKEGEYDPKDFIRNSEKNIDEMFEELKKFFGLVKDEEYKKVLDYFFSNEEFVEKFKYSPAAMYIHHGWIGGLLEHTLGVLEICLSTTKICEEIDLDLLIVGAVLHDIGKIEEITTTTQIKITEKGNLLGHMAIGIGVLTRALDELNLSEIKKNKLIHTMVSHHGEIANGSIKPPMTIEALIISRADELDASLNEMIGYKKIAKTNDSFIYSNRLGKNIYLK